MRRSIILGSLVGLAFTASPLFVSAQSIADLQAQVQALLARISALQSQQQDVTPPPPPDGDDYPAPRVGTICPNLTITMQRGARDATTRGQVSELQIWLANRYNLNDDDVVTGYFGATTERYVRQFQGDQGLPAYGIVGSLTRAAIARTCQGPTPPPPPPTEPKCGVNTFNVQNQCGDQGVNGALYQSAYVQCHDGHTQTLGAQSSCKDPSTWLSDAQRVCENRCAPRPVSCPIYNAPLCGPGETLVSGGVDANGCTQPGRCVPVAGTKIFLKAPTSNATFSVGTSIPIAWHVEGAPTSSQVLLHLEGVRVEAGVGGGTWQSPVLVTGQSTGSYSWRTGEGFLTSHGLYRITAYVVACEPQGCHMNYDSAGGLNRRRYATSESVLVNVAPAGGGGITVTAPNGGEEWEVGKLHTVTWAPYGYNPDVNGANDVVVYLLSAGGDKIGRVMDTGKASLHTYLNIDNHQTWATPGRYYIEAINTKTGARDRSDAPFTILPRAIDMKINGSDLPVSVSDNQAVSVSWQIGAPYQWMEGGCTLSGLRTTPGANPSVVNIGTSSGSGTYYAFAPTPGAYSSVNITCIDGAKGLTHTDYGSLLSIGGTPSVASLQITSPNGGEQIDIMKQMDIAFSMKGLKTPFSIALYKNDTWFSWINREVGMDKSLNDTYSYSWIPNSVMPIPMGLGNVWKIYITAQKADGTGYVDDKSDAPFSFVTTTAASPSCTVSTNKPSYTLGEPIVVSWTSANASYITFDPQSSAALMLPGDKLSAQGSHPLSVSTAGSYSIVMRSVSTDGQVATCAVPLSIVSAAQACAGGDMTAEYNGSCYAHFNAPKTRAAAAASCVAWGGTLAAVTSAAEEQYLFDKDLLPAGTFIGLQKVSGAFAWDTGEALQHTKWIPGEPNNARGDENYVVWTYWQGSWGWNDTYDTSTRYLCEKRLQGTAVAPSQTQVAAAASVYQELIGALQQLVSLLGR